MYKELVTFLNTIKILFLWLALFSLPSHASFIEATMGTAVIDDATASYYNPAALILLKNTQFIALGSLGSSQSRFNGQAMQISTGFIESGSSSNPVNYYLPSLYFGLPTKNDLTFGIAAVGNSFNNELDGHSILRYAQSNNTIQDTDLVPALGFKLNQYISLGASATYSHAHFLFEPTIGFPSLNIPDSHSINETWSNAWGADAGILVIPTKATLIGFVYRSAISYSMTGKSIFKGASLISSNNYGFNFWTPARSILSATYFQTPRLSYIGTLQYIQWSIFKKITLHNIATPKGILTTAKVPYNFHDSWLVTLGSNYRISPKWIIRAAGSYTQAPSNGRFQIDNGDSFTLGASVGYTIFKSIILDGSYAHIFIRNQKIHITSQANFIEGINKQSINTFALKLTVHLDAVQPRKLK